MAQTNFAHGYPVCCVSVAYEHQGELTVGVVYDPFRDELFRAVRGEGAWVNALPLHVSATSDLAHALLATGFPYDRSALDPVLAQWDRLIRLSQAVRRDGAAALNLCYVAAGRFDGLLGGHTASLGCCRRRADRARKWRSRHRLPRRSPGH